jgi:5-formyltetrahydrofolate cyclo-ligase
VAELPAFAGAGRIALYAALSDELPTRPLFDLAHGGGLAVSFPRVEGEALVFAEVARWEDLVRGRYGVRQPHPQAPRCGPGRLIVVPGLAFDGHGRRLGRGGGYYDRALAAAEARGALRVGLAYEAQIVEAVPVEPHDQPVDVVVTECGVHGPGGSG